MKTFAQYISRLFHPMTLIILTPFIILYKQTSDAFYAFKWMVFSLLFLFLAMMIFYVCKPKELLKDFDIEKRENRIVFYSIGCIVAIGYFFVAVLFKGLLFPLSIVALGIIIGLVILEISSFYIKVSVHVASASAFAITMGALYGIYVFLVACAIVPVIAWARVVLRKHTNVEVLAGAIVGSFVTALTLTIGKLIQ